MGNVFGQPAAAIQWNIPPVNNQNNQNNLNRAHRSQMGDMVMHFGFPLMCIAFLVYQRRRCEEEKERQLAMMHQQQEQRLTQIHSERLSGRGPVAGGRQQAMRIIIQAMEDEEDKKQAVKQQQLDSYEASIEKILHIKCSPFKSKEQRLVLQDSLINQLADSQLNDTIRYLELMEIFEHDARFCGGGRKNNGKLRFVYSRQWQLQLEVQKYRSILDRLKQMPSPSEIK